MMIEVRGTPLQDFVPKRGTLKRIHMIAAALPIPALTTALFVLLTLVYVASTPRWYAYDEPAHFHYVAGLVGVPDPAPVGTDYEMRIQPPLAYLVYSPFLWLARDADHAAQYALLRLVTICIAALVVFVNMRLIGQLLGTVRHRRVLWLVAGLLIACNPGFIVDNARVTNDTLLSLLVPSAVLVTLRLVHPVLPRHASRELLTLGLLLGLAGATKTLALPLLALPVCVVGLRYCLYRRERSLLPWLLPALTLSLCVVAPYYIFNLIARADPFGLIYWRNMGNNESRPMALSDIGQFISFSFTTFWYRVAARKPVALEYLPFVFLSLAPFVALIRARTVRLRLSAQRLITGCTCALSGVAYIGANIVDYGPEGRYLYDISGPLAVIIATSIAAIAPGERRKILLLGGVALYMVVYALSNGLALADGQHLFTGLFGC